MNVVEAALVGGLVGALFVSVLGVLLAWRERRHNTEEVRDQRAHDLKLRMLEHDHHLQRAALEDAARLRDARVARLTVEAKELALALYDLERLALLMQWGESADKDEMKRLELSARTRFESARAGLTLDPAGGSLTTMFESLTVEIARYQAMAQSHRVLVEARAVQQAIDHAGEMEVQRARVVEGVTDALGEARRLLASVAVPMEALSSATSGADAAAPPAADAQRVEAPLGLSSAPHGGLSVSSS